jgi:hypothetical protein
MPRQFIPGARRVKRNSPNSQAIPAAAFGPPDGQIAVTIKI